MKNLALVLIVFCLSQITFGQTNTFPSTGNVGIGTTTPNYTLDVVGSGSHKYLLNLSNPWSNRTIKIGTGANAGAEAAIQVTTDAGAAYNLILNPDGGNIGIGINAPTNKLTVQQSSGGSGPLGTNGTGGMRVAWSSGYGVSLDAWDSSHPYWGLVKFSANTPTVVLGG